MEAMRIGGSFSWPGATGLAVDNATVVTGRTMPMWGTIAQVIPMDEKLQQMI
jgi:hypothetical protein